MPIILRAVSLDDVPLTQSISARFEGDGGTIGRADTNTMTLPDPERHISRQQAQIARTGSGFTIRNIGAANPILVRNLRLMQGETAPLHHHDEVCIGGYRLEVLEVGENAMAANADDEFAPATPAFPGPRERQTGGPARADFGLGDGNAALSVGNPFADLLQAAPPAVAPPIAPDRSAAPAVKPTFAPSSARLPDDFDPFGQPPAAPATKTPEPAGTRGFFGDLIPDVGPSSLDDMFGLGGADRSDRLKAFSSEAPMPSDDGRRPASVDPLDLFGRQPPAPAVPVAATFADDVPELRASYRPPRPLAPAAVASRERTPLDRAPSTTAADGASLWEAFCDGAKLRPERGQDLDVEAMRSIGAMLRATVEGTMQLITVRSATRHELHAQVTVIQPRENNPLKFSPDPQSALEQLLQPPLRGFLAGPEAMSDAMADLVSHAIGSMAGTRAALEGVLARFVPEELEAKIATRSLLDSVMPGHRKARLWELYREHYGAIRDEAQEDFHALFGKAFLTAYEQQLERLANDKIAASSK